MTVSVILLECAPSPGHLDFPESNDRSDVNCRDQTSGRGSAWLERLVRDQEVAGSNPVAPTDDFEDLVRPQLHDAVCQRVNGALATRHGTKPKFD